jgi:hypothetical protein
MLLLLLLLPLFLLHKQAISQFVEHHKCCAAPGDVAAAGPRYTPVC